MSKPWLIFAAGIIIVALALGLFAFNATGNATKNLAHDAFAQCLSDSGAKMYGAYWCSHCNNQKQLFGSSWKYVNYIECSLPNRAGQTQACNGAGINAYPTWEFQDGRRTEGELSFEQLSQYSRCALGR